MIGGTSRLEGYRDCQVCAVEEKMRARRCHYCIGQLGLRELMYLEIKKRRRRRVAPYLSALVPGLGHWYSGRRYVGTYFFLMAPLSFGLAIATYQRWNWGIAVMILSMALVWLIAMVDSRKGPYYFAPPCQISCPGDVACSRYVHLAAEGKDLEALELVEAVCPFPGTIGRICHHPCETDCNRSKDGEAVAICALKRFVDDHSQRSSNFYLREIERDSVSLGKRVAVVGAGPSGLSAAVFLRVLGFDVTLFDAMKMGGGTPTMFAPGYRLPRAVYAREVDRILETGIEQRFGEILGADFTLQDLQNEGFSGVYLALGAMRSVKLPHTGDRSQGFLDGREFLAEVIKGDIQELPGDVLVIGGGNVAMDVARSAIRCRADNVRIICLEKRPEPRERQYHHDGNEWTEIKPLETGEFMPAWPWEIEDTVEEGVEIIDSGATISFAVEDGRVVQAECQEVLRVDTDDQGRLIPVLRDGSSFAVKADWVITAVGSSPDYTALGGPPAMLSVREEVPLVLLPSLDGMSIPVLAGGDFVRGPASVIEGISAGREAAMYLYQRIMGDPDLSIRFRRRIIFRPWSNYADSHDRRMRRKQVVNASGRARKTFDEVYLGFEKRVAREEADRCIRCDWPLVRESKVRRYVRSLREGGSDDRESAGG
ncbi:MAG: FAD-dependent oxidoreductase [bacterium]|nr:MAG: FAD-dependent oxidoreductase [bacterium]